MYELAHKQRNTYNAIALGILLVYTLITWAVPLLHDDDCPVAHGTPGTHSPSEGTCPACNFLAGANATDVPCDPTPVLMESKTPPEFVWNSAVVITSPCEGSIILRGPPVGPLS